MEHAIKLIVDDVEVASILTPTQRQRVKDALVKIIERLSTEATTAAEVEALAAAAHAFSEVDMA